MKTKKYAINKLLFAALWVTSISVQAVPILQVGAPAGAGDTGTYADYQGSTSNPAESDTAITAGNTLYAAGAYSNGNEELLIGGKYPSGLDWTDFGFASNFTDAGAILMATVPDGTLGGFGNSITVDGFNAIYSTSIFESGFTMSNPPSDHDPVKNNDYLFFDIGNFAKNVGAVPNFVDETGAATGEVKTLSLAISGFEWVHFDLLALATDSQGKTDIVTNLKGNPGSHDVTWKNDEDGGGGPKGNPVPEPDAIILFGIGLVTLGLSTIRRQCKVR